MRRREFIRLAGGAATASVSWPLAVHAQPGGKVSRVGLIFTTSPTAEMAGPDPIHPLVRTFVRTLRILGYIEGQNIVVEGRWYGEQTERLPALAQCCCSAFFWPI